MIVHSKVCQTLWFLWPVGCNLLIKAIVNLLNAMGYYLISNNFNFFLLQKVGTLWLMNSCWDWNLCRKGWVKSVRSLKIDFLEQCQFWWGNIARARCLRVFWDQLGLLKSKMFLEGFGYSKNIFKKNVAVS